MSGSARFQTVDEDIHLLDPLKQLEMAQEVAPYKIRLPSALPAGATLLHANWYDDNDPVVSVDVWYLLPTGGRLHVWQTNIPGVPLEGDATSVPGTQWSKRLIDWDTGTLIVYSTTFEDGVALSVDAPASHIDEQSLLETAESVE